MSTSRVEVDVAAHSKRVAAICDMIGAGISLTASKVATISAMIDDIAAATTASDGKPKATGRSNRRMCDVGSYGEVCVLGKGAFGVVVRARHRSTGQDVALKSNSNSGGIGLLLREACFMAACRGHPSLVRFDGVVRNPGTKEGYSLVMEYVGPNLDQVLTDRQRRFPEADVRTMMRQLLEGAAVMHQHGIVHRDIKPQNILVAKDGGAVKIVDLGLAKSMNEKEKTFYVAGTKGYMAPEMLLWTKNHDTAVDMWSLGCVMTELLTGEITPFYGEGNIDQLYSIFDVLGVPGKRAWQGLKPHQYLNDEVEQWRARQRRLGHRNRLRELFPKETLSRDGFEVLKGLLTCDPKKRLTAAAALRCAWFADPPAVSATTNAIPDSKVCDAATKSWSWVWRTVMSFTGRVLDLFRPKGLLK